MDPREQIREAIAKGVRGKELKNLFVQLIEGADNIPEAEYVAFIQEIRSDPEVIQAYTDAQEDARPGLEAAALAIPGAGVARAAGPFLAEATALGGTLEGSSLLGGAAATLAAKNPALMRSILGFMGTALGIGASTTAFFQGVEGGPSGGQVGLAGEAASRASIDTQVVGETRYGGGTTPNIESPRGGSEDRAPAMHGFNVMVIDRDGSMTGTPGNVVVLSPQDLDPALGAINPRRISQTLNTLNTQGGDDAVSAIINSVVAGAASGLGTNPIAAGLIRPQAVISPQTIGVIRTESPFQTVGGIPLGPEAAAPDSGLTPEQIRRRQQLIDVNVGAGAPGGGRGEPPPPRTAPVGVRAGGEIAPRTFQTHQGRPLLEWASAAAQRYNVPLNLLYGIIDHESNWNPQAVGDNGNSFGLAQIYMPVWGGGISKGQALNPVFALNWTAQKLRQRFNQYGTWEAAVAAHNSPAAANHLAKTGRFQNKKSASYVSDVLSRANMSGIGNDMFNLDPDTAIDGTGGSGATYTPFQASDEATLREFILQEYQDLLGRKPTDGEYTTGLQRLRTLERHAYSANLRQAKGGESTAVDIEAQFREGIRETGEFAFTEDTHQTDSFTDYAAGVARLLQQGL